MKPQQVLVLIRGAGDLASGTAHRLCRAGFPVVMLELPKPTVIRRTVSFAAAVWEGKSVVEGGRTGHRSPRPGWRVLCRKTGQGPRVRPIPKCGSNRADCPGRRSARSGGGHSRLDPNCRRYSGTDQGRDGSHFGSQDWGCRSPMRSGALLHYLREGPGYRRLARTYNVRMCMPAPTHPATILATQTCHILFGCCSVVRGGGTRYYITRQGRRPAKGPG